MDMFIKIKKEITRANIYWGSIGGRRMKENLRRDYIVYNGKSKDIKKYY